MDKRFLKAFLTPRATRLCGYDLFPWCLKHRLWLHALEHPVIVGGDPTADQIVFFAKVCSETPLGKVTWRDRYETAKLALPANRYAALDAIRQHIRLDCWPRFWDRPESQGDGARNNGIPWALGVITNLTRSGFTLEDAMNLPECQAIWLSASASIAQGGRLEILTSDDEELLDALSRVDPPAT